MTGKKIRMASCRERRNSQIQEERGRSRSPSQEMICSFDKVSIESSSISPGSGSGYGSEVETEISAEDTLTHSQSLDENENQISQHSNVNKLGQGTFSDLLGPSDSELFQLKNELIGNLRIMGDAECIASQILTTVQAVRLQMDSKASLPALKSQPGEHKLIQKLNLIGLVVREMGMDWQHFFVSQVDGNKLKSLEQSNRLLQEQLETSRTIQNCLESELKFLGKEKALLNDEIKELTMEIATQQKTATVHTRCEKTNTMPVNSVTFSMTNTEGSRTSPHQYAEIQKPEGQFSSLSTEDSNNKSNNNSCSRPTALSTRPSSGIRYVGRISTTNIRKREHDFDSIMNFVRERGTVMDSLNNQMEKYNEDFQTLQEEIYQVASEKMELHKAYEELLEEHNKLLKERQSYEGILNLILKEKKGTEESIHQILETLISKLNAIASEEGTNSRFAVLESALHAVQGQNSSYRDEITELKCKLNTVEQNHLLVRNDLEANLSQARKEAEDARNILQVETKEFAANRNSWQEKITKVQELHDIVASAKADVEKALNEKEAELAKLRSAMEGLQKTNYKLQKKFQELQKINNKLAREAQEHKKNGDQLNALVGQLRNSLKEQKVQWSERLKAAGDEAIQIKDHCRWLQSQIDNLNHQLADSHERIKSYEKDKTTLAQQVMSAEEERKVVDRKLEELKAALQGDTVLREALMERNEALQIEINRLRRAKLMNLVITKEGDHLNSEPPSEISTLEAMSSLASVPQTFAGDKSMNKKNRYAANMGNGNYPGRDTARNAISAHMSGLVSKGGESPLGID